jgi:hypothetical protein
VANGMIEKLFKKIGADWDQFKTLLSLSIRMDFRVRGEGTKKRKISPVFRSLIFYGFMGLFLAISLVTKVTPFLYSLLILTYSMVMMAFAVILEFSNTLLDPDDVDILSHRPVRSRTYFLSRLCNLLFFILLMSTTLCFVPSIFGMFVNGSSWRFPLIFFPVAIIANLVSASLVVLFYTGLLRLIPYERFKDIIAYLQIGFSFIIFLLYQLVPRMSREFIQEGVDIYSNWLYAIPPAWFAGSVQVLMGLNRGMDSNLTVLALCMTIVLVCFSFKRISLQYTELIANLRTKSFSKKPNRAVWTRKIEKGLSIHRIGSMFRTPEIKAGFYLTSHLLKKDRYVKMGIYPVFGGPLAIIFLAIVQKELTDPFVERPFSGQSGLSGMISFFIFFMSYFFLKGITFSRDWEASWIFYSAPLKSPGRFYQGVKLTIFLRLLLPFFLIFGLIYSTQIPVIHSVKHTLSLFLLGLAAFSTVSLLIKEYPFSRKRERGEGSQRFAFLIIVFPFFTMALLIQTFMYKSSTGWWVIQCGLICLVLILEIIARKKLDRTLTSYEFSG